MVSQIVVSIGLGLIYLIVNNVFKLVTRGCDKRSRGLEVECATAELITLSARVRIQQSPITILLMWLLMTTLGKGQG